MSFPEPSEANGYLMPHAVLLLESYRRWKGRALVDPALPAAGQARRLFFAPFVVLSHDTAPDPVFTYANRTALDLFELSWDELVRLPSRYSAEPLAREERARLLTTVARQGYIDDYRGVRISRHGRRFFIEQATVWNVVDAAGTRHGQAATFDHWTFVDGDAVSPPGSSPASGR
jgi:hypothetical protein